MRRRPPNCFSSAPCLAERDDALGEHLTGVATAAKRVGARLGVAGRDLQDLVYAAELHDVGKVAIPDSILSKPGPLDAGEWDFMRRHTVIGERILTERSRSLDEPRRLALLHCVLSHHGPSSAPGGRFASAEALALFRLNALDATVKGALEHGLPD